MLEVTNLTAGYSGLTVVRDFNVSIGRGEIVAILGANGAGKTTTLTTIFGLLPAISGAVLVDGRPIDRSMRGSAIGFVPENRALARSLTVQENFKLVPDWTVDPYDLFDQLIPLRKRVVGLLSGGEQQMVAIARAMISSPSLLLIDELSLGLAPLLVVRLLERLRALADETGTGILLVEQHVRQALKFASRGIVLARGQVVLEGPASVLAADPKRLADAYLGFTSTSPDVLT